MTPIDEIVSNRQMQNQSYGFKSIESQNQNEDQDNRMIIAKKKRALLKKSRPYIEQQNKPMFGGHEQLEEENQNINDFKFQSKKPFGLQFVK